MAPADLPTLHNASGEKLPTEIGRFEHLSPNLRVFAGSFYLLFETQDVRAGLQRFVDSRDHVGQPRWDFHESKATEILQIAGCEMRVLASRLVANERQVPTDLSPTRTSLLS